MPVLGIKRYSGGCPKLYLGATPLPSEFKAEFVNVQVSSSNDSIVGRLRLSARHYTYDGIKICLQLQLKQAKEGKSERNVIDMLEHNPIETMLSSCGVVSGYQKLDFKLQFPKNQILPHPFFRSSGNLSYKLVALITANDKKTWDTIAQQMLHDFKGYYNLSDLVIHPLGDCKPVLDGKITSNFSLNNPVLLVGRDTILNATLQLEGILACHVDVTITFQRNTQFGEIVDIEIISQENRQFKSNEHDIILEWNLKVPQTSTVTYYSPMYSVRYFMKYDALFKQLSDGNCDANVFAHGDSIVEVKVGTSFQNSSDSYKITEDLQKLTLETRRTSTRSLPLSQPRTGSFLTSLFSGHHRQTSVTSMLSSLMSRRPSLTSMPSLPPAYSNLSRMGSLMSMETLPPNYEDLTEVENPVLK